MGYRNLSILLFGLFTYALNGQVVDCSRTAVLQDGAYEMSGMATLERFEGGALQLRLESDFLTQSGPDVQIFLSNDSTSTAGGIMLVDIGTTDGLSHFSGELTIPINDNVAIGAYDWLVFRCVSFNAFWGGGRLGVATCNDPGGNGGGMDTTMTANCEATIVATTNWESSVTICPEDGEDDVVELLNSLRLPAGDQYAFVFADANNNIRFLHFEDTYNFEGTSQETEYVFGVFYRGNLSYNIGEPITSITADTCAQLSSLTSFLTVFKEDCVADFDCKLTLTATTNWATMASVCPGDGEPDVVPFLNNEFEEPGDHYAYLITDTQNRLTDVHFESSFDFENSGGSPSRVYGISYAGNLNYTIGDPISAVTADSCFQLSDTTLYLTVLKNGCDTMPPAFSISGQVRSPSGSPIIGAEVRLNIGATTKTDDQGNYNFQNLPGDTEYNLKAYHDSEPSNGISATDLVLTARHILNYITFTDPYQLIAADVNNNGSISASDLVQMKRVILGLSDSFANNTSWRFMDANHQLSGLSDTPVEIITVLLTADVSNLDFIGVKIGDVNGNASLEID